MDCICNTPITRDGFCFISINPPIIIANRKSCLASGYNKPHSTLRSLCIVIYVLIGYLAVFCETGQIRKTMRLRRVKSFI